MADNIFKSHSRCNDFRKFDEDLFSNLMYETNCFNFVEEKISNAVCLNIEVLITTQHSLIYFYNDFNICIAAS